MKEAVGNQLCVLCGRAFTEYGNNAEPVKKGRCCNVCNDHVVIPERIRRMQQARESMNDTE